MHPLDNPVWSALTGPQRALAEGSGTVVRFPPGISLFGAFADEPGPADWEAMAGLIGPGGVVITAGPTGAPPDGWATEFSGDGVQMTGEDVVADGGTARDRPRAGALGADDVEDMLALVALSQPGPFTRRTWELGGYVGVREQGRLVAMAGERMHPESWGEISAVATHPDHRRRGLGRARRACRGRRDHRSRRASRSCTPPPTTPAPSASTGRWGSPCAAPSGSRRSGRRPDRRPGASWVCHPGQDDPDRGDGDHRRFGTDGRGGCQPLTRDAGRTELLGGIPPAGGVGDREEVAGGRVLP